MTVTLRTIPALAAVVAAVVVVTAACEPRPAETAASDLPPVVYVEDHTGPGWPVRAATARWAVGSTRVSIRYGPCRAGAGCIRVTEWTDPNTDVMGRTDHQNDTATIEVNNAYTDPRDRAAVACHELGHGIGLPHSNSLESCMYREIDYDTGVTPDAHDYALLNRPATPTGQPDPSR